MAEGALVAAHVATEMTKSAMQAWGLEEFANVVLGDGILVLNIDYKVYTRATPTDKVAWLGGRRKSYSGGVMHTAAERANPGLALDRALAEEYASLFRPMHGTVIYDQNRSPRCLACCCALEKAAGASAIVTDIGTTLLVFEANPARTKDVCADLHLYGAAVCANAPACRLEARRLLCDLRRSHLQTGTHKANAQRYYPADSGARFSPVVYYLDCCAGCNKAAALAEKGMQVCGGCTVERYCSLECQKRDWKRQHRVECKLSV